MKKIMKKENEEAARKATEEAKTNQSEEEGAKTAKCEEIDDIYFEESKQSNDRSKEINLN